MEIEEGERRITARRDSLKYITSQKGNTERQTDSRKTALARYYCRPGIYAP